MTAREFYQSAEDERLDKEQLERLLAVLVPVSTGFRRKDGVWTIQGTRGKVFTWGDKFRLSYAFYVRSISTVDLDGSPRAWGEVKKKLAFMQVTQDGDTEGVFKLDRLPTEDEAALIRDVLGIRRRPNYSEETLERLRQRFAA